MKKNFTIQITRIVAMFMIIVCHLVQEFDCKYIQMTSQFFNVGVFIFIFISGYLYGMREIKEPKKWFLSRFVKIMIPVYIFMIFIFGLENFVLHNFDVKYVFIYLLDLQFIFGGVLGAQHLWFLTIIMICYMITPVLYKYKEKLLNNDKIILLSIAILSICFAYVRRDLGRMCMYILLYISSYIYMNKNTDKKKSKILLSVVIIGLFMIRIIAKTFLDGTVLYDTIIVCFTQILLAYYIYLFLNEILRNKEMENNVIINHLDAVSYYVYITHYMFIVGPVKTMDMTKNIIINSIISVCLAWITGIILYKISKYVLKLLRKDFNYGKN